MQTPKVCYRCKEEPEYWLIDVRVRIAQQQEGDTEQMRWFCEDCTNELTTFFLENGFESHRHGGINWLEDVTCAGAAGDCPVVAHIFDDEDYDKIKQQEANGGIISPDSNAPPCDCPPYGATFQNLMSCPLDIQYHVDNQIISNAIGLLREAKEQHGIEIG